MPALLTGTPPLCLPTRLLLRLEHRSGSLWPLVTAFPCGNLHLDPFTREKLTCSLLVLPPPQIFIKEGSSTFTQAGYKVINVTMAEEMKFLPLG